MARPPSSVSIDQTLDGDPDQDTVVGGEWPVPDQYLVEPASRDHEAMQQDGTTGVARRRFPPDVGPGLLSVLVAAILLIPAAIVVARLAADDGSPSAETGGNGGVPAMPVEAAGKPVADVVGLRLPEARARLEAAGFASRASVVISDQPEGVVLSQEPRAGAPSSAEVVVLTVSTGAAEIAVPDVQGLSATNAGRALRRVGLVPQIRLVRSDESAGTVVGQDPIPDDEVEAESVVVLRVAKEPSKAATPKVSPAKPVAIEVPDLVGLDRAEARSRLRRLGLRATVISLPASQPAGTVVRQTPAAGTELRKGEPVELSVSSGPPQVAIPDVIGLDEQSARQQLESAGFTVEVADEPTDDPHRDGLVVAQERTERSEKGATVTVTVARFT